MKKYFKILIITLTIQLGGILLKMIAFNLGIESNTLLNIGNICVLFSILMSFIVDIILAIRWGTNIRQKLVYIFLMPTNYFWLVYLLWAFWYIGQWIDMITGI